MTDPTPPITDSSTVELVRAKNVAEILDQRKFANTIGVRGLADEILPAVANALGVHSPEYTSGIKIGFGVGRVDGIVERQIIPDYLYGRESITIQGTHDGNDFTQYMRINNPKTDDGKFNNLPTIVNLANIIGPGRIEEFINSLGAPGEFNDSAEGRIIEVTLNTSNCSDLRLTQEGLKNDKFRIVVPRFMAGSSLDYASARIELTPNQLARLIANSSDSAEARPAQLNPLPDALNAPDYVNPAGTLQKLVETPAVGTPIDEATGAQPTGQANEVFQGSAEPINGDDAPVAQATEANEQDGAVEDQAVAAESAQAEPVAPEVPTPTAEGPFKMPNTEGAMQGTVVLAEEAVRRLNSIYADLARLPEERRQQLIEAVNNLNVMTDPSKLSNILNLFLAGRTLNDLSFEALDRDKSLPLDATQSLQVKADGKVYQGDRAVPEIRILEASANIAGMVFDLVPNDSSESLNKGIGDSIKATSANVIRSRRDYLEVTPTSLLGLDVKGSQPVLPDNYIDYRRLAENPQFQIMLELAGFPVNMLRSESFRLREDADTVEHYNASEELTKIVQGNADQNECVELAKLLVDRVDIVRQKNDYGDVAGPAILILGPWEITRLLVEAVKNLPTKSE